MFMVQGVVVDPATYLVWLCQNLLDPRYTYQQQIFNLAFQNQLFQE
jgi:hypothetical protein